MMRVLLIKDKNTVKAQDNAGNIYPINGLVIPKNKKPSAFYEPGTSFFNAVCMPGTLHNAELFGDNKAVNIY